MTHSAIPDPEAWREQTAPTPAVQHAPQETPPTAGGRSKSLMPWVIALGALVVVLASALGIVVVQSNQKVSNLQADAAKTSASLSSSSASVAAASSKSAAANAPFTLTGTLTMPLSAAPGYAGSCTGSGGYNDIAAGTSVTVYDQNSAVIATGYLNAGDNTSGSCVFKVTVANVPGDAKFYQVEISHRGKITVSAADAKNGLFGATLGN